MPTDPSVTGFGGGDPPPMVIGVGSAGTWVGSDGFCGWVGYRFSVESSNYKCSILTSLSKHFKKLFVPCIFLLHTHNELHAKQFCILILFMKSFILFVDRVMPGGKSVYILNFRAHILICYLGYIILGISCFVVPIVKENIFTSHGFISLATCTTSTLSWILGKYTLKPKRAHIYTK